MKNKDNIAVLVLAAGKSSRMRQPKQLLGWGKTTLLNHAIEQAKEVTQHVFVVLGAYKDIIKVSIPKDVAIVFNPDWEQGMGTSIALGISELRKNHNFNTVLIMLADQPFLDSRYLCELKRIFVKSECKIAATFYGKNNGVPAIFHNSVFDELLKLNKDYGAKKLMKKLASDIKGLHPEGKEIDIDTFETYQELLIKLEQ